MATTTNFGWETPDDTDLVKDGAAAIRTLGQSIDTSMADLEGGTTGQVLAKNSNTDMDFIWTSPNPGDITAVTAGTGISGGGTSGDVTITNSMATAITTAGDLIKGTGSGTFNRLGIGSTGQVLTVASGAPSWATPSAPAYSGCAATNSSDYTISNGVYTALTFNTERFDTDGFHDTTTNTSRFTVPAGKAGKYLFSGNISFDSNGTGVRAAYIYKNGSFTRNGSEMIMSGTASGVTCAFAHVIDLVVGDYLEARALQTSGGVLSVIMGNTGTTVEFTFLGA